MNLSGKKNGYISPVVLLFIFLFISVPLIYWFVSSDEGSPEDVKGSSDVVTEETEGLLVNVTSESTWDMYVYLCKNSDECDESLTAGKRVGVFSGGVVSKFTVAVPLDETWTEGNVVKFYIKPGWGSSGRVFSAESVGDSGAEVKRIRNDGMELETIFITVGDEHIGGSWVGEFSDR
ncbi:hypothetical protein C4561_03165 [candidate division WWE3 bacterium]|jgi:hypothetical protein|uniref:Uncharacterized protein n=1 Tax=candidate division WWE3 bacterium TaxID=2053526 RepID=A0A3A4ZDI7_UNCKA|nr:MAG: hypothetical protein C4561_03165 [candidate division WWE3 bacterium]